jgi:2-iminobutanoate/2-iminopropanoate deaminase
MADELKTRIQTPAAPKASGPYSQAIVANGMVFCSGQVAVDPVTNQLIEGDIRAQTHRALKNLDAVLKAAGSNLHHAVKVNVYLAHFGDFAAMNEVYQEYFPDPLPARSTIEAGSLPRNVLVEIECTALIPRYIASLSVVNTHESQSTFDLDEDRDF